MKNKIIKIAKYTTLITMLAIIKDQQIIQAEEIEIKQTGSILYNQEISKTLTRQEGLGIVEAFDYNKIIKNSKAYTPESEEELKLFLNQMYANKEPYFVVELKKSIFPEIYKNNSLNPNQILRESVFALSNLNWYYSYGKTTTSITFVFTPVHFESDGRIESRNLFVERLANEIEKNYETEVEKTYALYGYIARHATYDYNTPILTNGNSDEVEAALASTLILKRTAVCQGYAELFSLVADRLGIENTVVTGKIHSDDENLNYYHAWNKVKVDGQWFNLDATWGDYNLEIGGLEEDHGNNVRASYFLFSDLVASKSRSEDISDAPDAVSRKYDVFYNSTQQYGLDSGLYKGKIVIGTTTGFDVYDLNTMNKIQSVEANPNTYGVVNGIVYFTKWSQKDSVSTYDVEKNEIKVWKTSSEFLGVGEEGVIVKNTITKNREVLKFERDGFESNVFKIGVDKNLDSKYNFKNVVNESNSVSSYGFKNFSKAGAIEALSEFKSTDVQLKGEWTDTVGGYNIVKDVTTTDEMIEAILVNKTNKIIMPVQIINSDSGGVEIFSNTRTYNEKDYTLIYKKRIENLNTILDVSKQTDFRGNFSKY